MISVIIPARNASATIGATLSSLAADRALIGEILLIDDGSEDDTVAVASEAARSHGLPLTVTSVQLGNAGAARNVGLAKARGDQIFFLDADDEIIPGGLALLLGTLHANPEAGLAVGASIHRLSRADKLKLPGRYSADRHENARRYLANELRSITIGSALVAAVATANIRFPERVGLDEDTLYWAAVLTRVLVTSVDRPVLYYNLDETRMAQRFVSNPRKVFLDIALQVNGLAAFGIDKNTLQERKAFIAQRIARHLIRRKRYAEAAEMMRVVRLRAGFRSGFKSLQYRMRIGVGRIASSLGRREPVGRKEVPRLRSQGRRILVLTADSAFPPVSGADLRNYQNASAAARFGDVLLVSVNPAGGGVPSDGRICIAALSRSNEPRGRSIRHRRTSVEMRVPRAALKRLEDLVRRFEPDFVIVEGMPLVALLDYLRPLVPRLILDMHNVESALSAQTRAASWFEKLLPRTMSDRHRIQRQEEAAFETVDRVWVCSDADRERLRRMFASRIPIDIVPNGIPRYATAPASLPPLAGTDGGWPVLLFVGHLGYTPNMVAAERLATKVLPLVRRTLPSARLILAGRFPKPAVLDLGRQPGVELIADPGDLASLFARSHISVVPLSQGGGTRIKIIEAMAWGLPVVATSIAAEGLGFIGGEEIMIAETDEALAQAVVALCTDSARLERQRRLAHEKAMVRFAPPVIEEAVGKGLGGLDG